MEQQNEKKKVNKFVVVIITLLLIAIAGLTTALVIVIRNNEIKASQQKQTNEIANRMENTHFHPVTYKPIIYLYPTEEMNVNVKLLLKDNITVSYPKYVDGWNVIAKEDGTLIDLDTNKELYSLYYECDIEKVFNIEEDGFVVEGKNVAEFLDEKLEILGLNSKEREEFIIYWLPKLEANKYNYIRFATKEEIDNNMPLEITPVPETTIRVLMTFKGLDELIDVKEQELTRVERSGYTAVEWGGTEIK